MAKEVLVHSRDVEFGLELPERVTGGVEGGDMDIVLEGGSNGGHIEAEAGSPVVVLAGGGRAVTRVVAGSKARSSGAVSFSAEEVADEFDVIELSVVDVPDTVDNELLGAVLADGLGVTVGATADHGEVLSSADLVDDDVVLVVGDGHLRLDEVGLVGADDQRGQGMRKT